MFVGHYAASLALKKYDPKLNLGWLFIAVQVVDIFFFGFVLLGIERLNVVEGYTATNHFHLEYMPFTHSLLGTFIWAAAGYIFCRVMWKDCKTMAWVVAAAIASHWFLDLPVHTPDLPLYSDASAKLGFGLWNYRIIAFALEAGLLVIGSWIYLRNTDPISKKKRNMLLGLVAFMLLFHASQVFFPPIPLFLDKTILSLSAIVAYFLFAGMAYRIDYMD